MTRAIVDQDATASEVGAFTTEPGDSDDSLFTCLLYTSDAADERSSVDLGGRRIIKKQRSMNVIGVRSSNINNITNTCTNKLINEQISTQV